MTDSLLAIYIMIANNDPEYMLLIQTDQSGKTEERRITNISHFVQGDDPVLTYYRALAGQ